MVFLLITLTACHKPEAGESGHGGNRYAGGFSILQEGELVRILVSNPWSSARNVKMEYVLAGPGDSIPASHAGKTIIRLPVRRVICLSTSHLAFLEALGETGKVTGISGSGYVSNPSLRERIARGEVFDVGYGRNLDYEEILRQKPDLVLVYGVDSEIAGFLEKFRDLGIPAVICGEYLEESPLGKAEWIRFVAAFFGKEPLADSLFRQVETAYLELARQAAGARPSPVVMVGLPYRDTWWIPGGRSYLARLIADAGGNYVGASGRSRESCVISMEEALVKSSGAGFWIHTGMVSTRGEILGTDPRLGSFPLFRQGKIYNNNRRVTPGGGNDFWEGGTFRPDLVLADLVRIFHPGLLPDDTLTYYKEVP